MLSPPHCRVVTFYEVYGHHLLRDLTTHCYDQLVVGVLGITVKREKVGKHCYEASVVGALQVQNVTPHVKTYDIRYQGRQSPQA